MGVGRKNEETKSETPERINSKHETRNSKQARMFKIQMTEINMIHFEFWKFEICFGFRNSNFGFANERRTST